ncbi:MYADM protein, partial [Amia calva]|nr:MYADM protein [Amia calva]
MFTWCFFFTMSLLILLVEFIQFQSLIPVSWKNLPVTVSALAGLMTLTASVSFPWFVVKENKDISAKMIMATIFSCLTFVFYTVETYLLKSQDAEQRGYMASAPGLLKTFEVFGGCVIFVLASEQREGFAWWRTLVYCCCFLMSLSTIAVMLGDCAGRCLLPFDRILAAFSCLSVLLYTSAAVLCIYGYVQPKSKDLERHLFCTVITFLNLLAYSVDLAFSIRLLCHRV